MAFCTSCGAEVQGRFCVKCGSPAGAPAPSAAPPPPPPPPRQSAAMAPPPAPPQVPGKKKTSLLVWVLVGVVGLFVLLGVAVVGAGIFVVHKAKQAGLDPALMEKNPGLAVTKMLAAANPDIEVVRVDEAGGVITLREKSSGKTTTVDFEDIKRGRITFSSEGEKSVTFEAKGEGDSASFGVKSGNESVRFGGGSDFKTPAWLPAYPGAKAAGNYSAEGSGKEAGAFSFTTKDSTTKVLDFYANGLKSAGLEITSRGETVGEGGGLEAEDASRKVSATVSRGDDGTSVSVSFEAKK